MVRFSSVGSLVVLLGTGGLNAGGGDAVRKAGEETLATLERSIEELREIDRERRAKPEEELRIAQEELAEKVAELSELREERWRLASEVMELENQSVAWVRKWRDTQRRSAIGERYPSIATLDGRVYSDAEIVEVTSAGIEVRHSNGTARVRCDQLPSKWSERFVWTESEQEGVLAAERVRAAEFDRQVAARVEIAENRAKKRLEDEETAESRAALARLNRQRVTAASQQYSSPLSEPARQIGSRTYYYRARDRWSDRRYSSLYSSRYSYRPSVSCPSYGSGSYSRPGLGSVPSGSTGGSSYTPPSTPIEPVCPPPANIPYSQ